MRDCFGRSGPFYRGHGGYVAAPVSTLSDLLPALRERNFRVYYVGNLLSTTGAWAENLAIVWLAYRITDYDEFWLGLVAAAPAIPALLLSIPAGALIDRVRVRSLLFASQGTMMLLSLGLATLVASGAVRPIHLIAYQLVYRAAFSLDAPARQAFVAQLVPPELFSNAIALNATAFNTARFLGAAAFGAVIAVEGVGEAGCILLNAGSFAFSLTSLLLIRSPREPQRHAARDNRLLDGLRYAWRTPHVRAVLGLMVVTALFGYQLTHLLPVYAEKVWNAGPQGLEWLSMAVGIGALVGGIALSLGSAGVHRGRLILRYVTLSPVLLAGFALAPTIGVGIALVLAIGFLSLQVHAATAALIQSSVPDALRGRVMALFTLCVLGAFPCGGLLGGAMAKAFGAPATTLIGAGVVLVAALAMSATHPELRDAP